MKRKNLKSFLFAATTFAALATPSSLIKPADAYTLNTPQLVVRSKYRDLHINFGKEGKKFVYTRFIDTSAFKSVSEIILNKGGLEKIITSGFSDFHPQISPKGDKIAFFRNIAQGYGAIIITDLEGKKIEPIVMTKITKVSWSPDATKLVYKDEFIKETKHTLTEEDIEEIKKRFGTQEIALKVGDIITTKKSYDAIMLYDLKTKTKKYLTTTEGNCEEPSFLNDGRIVYVFNKDLNRTSGKEIWIMNSDGTDKRPLVSTVNYEKEIKNQDGSTTITVQEGSASQLSTDGTRIVYILDKSKRIVQRIPQSEKGDDYKIKVLKDDYQSGIYLMDLKTKETKLIVDEGLLWFPTVSGDKVYFSWYDLTMKHDIYSIKIR